MFQQFDVHSMLFVPFRVDGRLVGMAAFDRSGTVRPFEPEALAVARTIGAELSVGLQNIQLVKDARRRASQLERIADFTRTSQASDTAEGVLDGAMGTLRELVPADRIGVLFFDDAQRELRLVARMQDGVSAVQVKGGPLVAVTGTYAGQVWTTQTPLTIADTHEGATGRPRNDTGIRSMALFPFDGGPGLRGVLSVGSAIPRSYSDSDIAVLQQMVNQFASALQSRAALAARQASAAQESLVNALSARYQRATDVNDMLSATLRDLGEHLGAKRGRIRLTMEPAPELERAAESSTGMDVW
jgi:GAF domain-containing protein